MAGNPDLAALWANADVYIADTVDATIPADADAAFGSEWTPVGLLDGDDGFSSGRESEQSDHFAWGGIIVRTGRKNFKLTKKFTVLEDNAATRRLIWPGSTDTELVVPQPTPVKLAFELREGTKVKRLITRRHAEVDVDGDMVENESDLTRAPLAAVIFPDAEGVLFDRQSNYDDLDES